MLYQPLTREEVASTIEGRSVSSRVPTMIHFWVHPDNFGDRRERVLEILSRYPYDIQRVGSRMPDPYVAPEDSPEYRWLNFDKPADDTVRGLDSRLGISDWSQLDGILRDFPDPNYPAMFPNVPEPDGRYRLGGWWYCYFERHWSLRGMTEALTDYYTDPDSVKRLFRALTDFYMRVIERGKHEAGLDGIFTSDDIGTQTGAFFSPAIFREFFKPFYAELIAKAHSLGMHFWLHTCGNIEEFIPDFIEIGLDVLHPIQKHTMDERKIARDYGKDICIWCGLDVQQVIPWGTPDEVRAEVRHLIDTFNRPEGRMMLTAGNGINGDCTLESLEAFFSEAFSYGKRS